jgi:hypothetical protein
VHCLEVVRGVVLEPAVFALNVEEQGCVFCLGVAAAIIGCVTVFQPSVGMATPPPPPQVRADAVPAMYSAADRTGRVLLCRGLRPTAVRINH